jgi:hypothetical protein
VTREAYSHEVSSAGFWPGSGGIDYPAFYSYAYPAPDGFATQSVRPAAAFFHEQMGEFILPYDAVRNAAAPDETLLDFLQTTYEAAANAGWDRAALECPQGRVKGSSTYHVRPSSPVAKLALPSLVTERQEAGSAAPSHLRGGIPDAADRITDIARVRSGFAPFSAGLLACAVSLVCARGSGGFGCQCDHEVGAEGGGEAFEDADGGHGSTGFESGDGGLGHAGSLG